MFLSFADEDRRFTTDNLCIPLKRKGYNVFWHYSDFIAGLTIDENIVRAIKLCRRVIFLYSEYFHKSEFCQKELRYALHSHYSEYNGKYRRVIVVMAQGKQCIKELQQLQPLEVTMASDTSKRGVQKLIKRLQLGKSLSTIHSIQSLFLDTPHMQSLY